MKQKILTGCLLIIGFTMACSMRGPGRLIDIPIDIPELYLLTSLGFNSPKGISIGETNGGLSLTEGGISKIYTIVLQSQPWRDVNISIDAGSGIIVNPGSLVFTAGNWSKPQTVIVTAVDDTIASGERTARISHRATSEDPNYSNFLIGEVSVSIVDDDNSGSVLPVDSITAVEGGDNHVYAIALGSQPEADVTVNITLTDDAQLTITHGGLLFTEEDWYLPQLVTLRATDNFSVGENPLATITHTATSEDLKYNNIVIGTVSVSIEDNDSPGITLSETAITTSEWGDSATFTVRLNSIPTAPVTVAFSGLDGAEGTLTPSDLTFAADSTAMEPQIVTVTGKGDTSADGDAIYNITATPGPSEHNYADASLTVTNLDVNDTDKRVFVTDSVFSGNLEGILGADAKCQDMSDSNHPGVGTYKALIVDGASRIACNSANCVDNGANEHTDWVLSPNTTYYKVDSDVRIRIMTTNSAGIHNFTADGNLDSTFKIDSDSSAAYFTGLDVDWTTRNTAICNGWTEEVSGGGDGGSFNSLTSSSIGNSPWACINLTPLLCVEQ